MKQIITIGYLNKTLWGGTSSTVMENHGCALAIIEIVRYGKDTDKHR